MFGLACCRLVQAWSCALISSDMQASSSSHSLAESIDIWIERGLTAWPRDHSRDACPRLRVSAPSSGRAVLQVSMISWASPSKKLM